MAVAISACVPMASIVTRAPWSASRSSRSGMAVISFDLPVTASCPSTSRWRVAQAETRCRGPRPSPLAPGVGAARGLAVDRDDVGLRRAQALDPAGEAALEQGRVERGDHLAQG